MNNFISRYRQRGLSLVELMVAMLIGIVLLLGVMQIFSASKTAYSLAEGLARVQENGRFAMEYLSHDIRMAGHMGCTNDQILSEGISNEQSFLTQYTAFGSNAAPALQFNYSIQGYEAAGTAPNSKVILKETPDTGGGFEPKLPSELEAALDNRVKDSDILVLRYLDDVGFPVYNSAIGQTPTLKLIGGASGQTVDSADWDQMRAGLANPSLFALTRCDHIRIFQASEVTGVSVKVGETPLNSDLSGRGFDFAANASVLYRAESEVYYVGLNSQKRPSLYRARFVAPPNGNGTYQKEELVEGVENMQLLYGVDSTTSALPTGSLETLQTAAGIGSTEAAWRRVLMVQIGLVLQSAESASAPPATLQTQGVTFTAPVDKKMRTVYQGTVTLRNRLYGN